MFSAFQFGSLGYSSALICPLTAPVHFPVRTAVGKKPVTLHYLNPERKRLLKLFQEQAAITMLARIAHIPILKAPSSNSTCIALNPTVCNHTYS
jgi:hypothetical protein